MSLSSTMSPVLDLGASSSTYDDDGSIRLGTWDILAVVGYFVVIMSVGLISMFRPNRDTVSGFFLAGRHMFWLPVGASLFASNIGSEHFIGLSGTGAASGIAVGAFEFNALVLLQLLGFVFLPVYIASKVCTLPEYMMKRFGGQRIRMYLAVLSMVLYVFTKISVNLYSGAIFIQQALRWNIYFSIFALLFMTSICTIGGGLAAVIYIDVVQVLIMVVGSSVLLFKGLDAVGGWDELQTKYMMAIPNSTLLNPATNATCGVPGYDSWQILRAPVGSDMPWPGFLLGQTPASIWYWCADQMMVQKALSAKSLSDAQGATILTGWIKILPMFLIVIPGMISRVLYPNEVGCVDPEICESVCNNPVSCSNIAYPRLVLGIMPEGLRGIMISVMLAALMSDLTSIFNSSSTLFTMDIYRKVRGKDKASSRELLLVGRVCILVLVVVSILWIPLIQQMQGGQLYIYIQAIAAYLSPPIAVIFCMALTWRRMNEKGAFWGLMFGLVLGTVRMVLDFSFQAPPCTEEDTRPAWIGKVHYMYVAAFLFWTTGVVAAVISLLTPPDEEFRTIRTVIQTKRSKEPRPDEQEEDEDAVEVNEAKAASAEDEVEMQALRSAEDGDDAKVEVVSSAAAKNGASKEQGLSSSSSSVVRSPIPVHLRLLRWFCGFEEGEKAERNRQEMKKRLENISSLEQSTKQKAILYVNLAVILGLALFFYVYFCISPFTKEEVDQLRKRAFQNMES